MKILVYACHEGCQENLLREWAARGHEVYLTDGVYRWNSDRVAIPEGVIPGRPARPDVICVGITQDLRHALVDRLKALRLTLPIVMWHLWYPSTKAFAGLLYRRAAHVCICEYEQRCLRERWGIESEMMYPPIDTELYRPRATQPDPKLVMVVGNGIVTRAIMGWDKLVETMAKVYKQDPEIHFQILGDNPEIVAKDLPNVSTLNLKHFDLPEHEAKARSIIFPTTTSLVPSSMLGAMAIGKTVVAFDLDPHREVVQDGCNGYLIPCYDTDAFAERIMGLCRTSVDPEIGRKARKTVLEKCDHRRVADGFESLFSRVCG